MVEQEEGEKAQNRNKKLKEAETKEASSQLLAP